MLCLKKVYTDELLQLAILLSLLRADHIHRIIEAPTVGVGPAYDSWEMGRQWITRDTRIHPKAVDSLMLREEEVFEELNSLGRYSSSLWQDVTAYMGLTNQEPVASTSSESSSSPFHNETFWDIKTEPEDDLSQEVSSSFLMLGIKTMRHAASRVAYTITSFQKTPKTASQRS